MMRWLSHHSPLLLLLLLLKQQQAQGLNSQLDPTYFDSLREEGSMLLRDVAVEPNSNIFRVDLAQADETTTTETTQYRLASLQAFLPLSNGTHFRPGTQDDAAAALMAVHHFNNVELSPVLSQQDIQGCNVKLTMEIVDSKFSPIGSTRAFTESLQIENTVSTPLPTGVIGAYRSATTSPLAILTGVNGIPQVTYAATSTDFDVKEQFPLTGRTVPSSQGEAQVALDYFKSIGATHVGVLFVTDSFGSALQKAFQDAANDANLVTDSVAFSFSADLNGEEIDNAIDHLKKTQFRLFYVICFDNHLKSIVETALKYDIMGPEYLWIFPGFEPSAVEPIISGDPTLATATLGMGLLNIEGGVRREPVIPKLGVVAPLEDNPETGYEKFRTAWRKARAHPPFVDFVQSKLPASLETIEGFDRESPFSNEPGSLRPALYDAVTGMALAMCRAGKEKEFFTGFEIFEEFRELDFEGASGNVLINNVTGTREYTSLTFVLWNVQRFEDPHENGHPQVKMVPSAVYAEKSWNQIPGNPFIFADGTVMPPKSLPPVDEKKNFIGDAGRYAAFALMGLVMLASFLSLVWMVWFWNDRVVSSSQPLFLVLVSVGCAVMSSAIIPLSYDEQVTEDYDKLDQACMAGPWLYVIGAIVAFSALFAKTRGIHKAYINPNLDFIHVTSIDIFGTLLFLLILNVIILATWTVFEPREWTRTYRDASDVFNRPVESYGSCKGDNSLPFVSVLLVLDFLFLVLGNWWAYQSRNIETEYLESRYIGISMAAVLQAWCMGVPILIVVWNTPQAKFFVETGIIFVTSLAFLLLIFVPKILASIEDRKNATAEEKRKAYSNFIENRGKRDNEFDDDQPREEASCSSDDSSHESKHDGDTDETSGGKGAGNSELNASNLRDRLMEKQGASKARLGFSGAQKIDEAKDITNGLKIVHNPRSQRNLNIAQGREMSRKQLEQFCKDDDDDIGPEVAPVSSMDDDTPTEEHEKSLEANEEKEDSNHE